MKRIIACLLAVFFIFSAMPITVQASQENTWDPDNGVYDISTEEDLLAFRDCLNLANSSNSSYFFQGVTINLLQDITMTQDYVTPSYITYDAEFRGTFDGHNHKIININMVSNDGSTIGFLPTLDSATVQNLTFENVTIQDGKTRVGVIAPLAWGYDSIINCHITGNSLIKNYEYHDKNTFLGGFVGDKFVGTLDVENCSLGEDVEIIGSSTSGVAYTGGFVGFVRQNQNEVTFKNCVNKASVQSDDFGAGFIGIDSSQSGGEHSILIENCVNYGVISATSSASNREVYLSGIVGQTGGFSTVQCDRCFNFGDITCQNVEAAQLGGIIAEIHLGSVTNCFNAGNITAPRGSNAIGGVVSQPYINTTAEPVYIGGTDVIIFPSQKIEIANCYNTGDITADYYGNNSSTMIGGVCGNITGSSSQLNQITVNNCYSFGDVNFTDHSDGNNSQEISIGDVCGAVRENFVTDIYSKQNVKAIGASNTHDTTQPSHKAGYYDSAAEGGKVYPATIAVSGEETISSTPLATDLKETLDSFVDTENAEFESKGTSFRYLPWTYSDGSDGLGIHPIFGYNVINETPEADKEANGGYVSASTKGVAYEKINDSESNVVTITVVPNDGKELTNISVKDESGIPVNLTSLGSGVYSFTMPQCDVTVSATFTDSEDAPYNAYYLTVENNVDVNFLIDTEYYDAEDGYLEYEYISTIERESAERTSEPTVVSVESLTKYHGDNDYDGDRQLVLQAAPAQIGEKYIIKVYNRDGEFKAQFVRSIEDYCLAIKDRDDNFGYLARTILNYGQLANEYFEYAQKHELVNGEPYSIETVGDYTAQFTEDELNSLIESAGTPTINQGDKIKVTGVTYIAQLDPEFRFYIDGVTEEEAKELNVSISGGLTATVAKVDNADEENNICVRVTGLSSNDFGYNFSLTIGDASLTYNGYDYVYMATQYGSNEKLKAMMRGVYRYARASEAAFGDDTHIHPKNH